MLICRQPFIRRLNKYIGFVCAVISLFFVFQRVTYGFDENNLILIFVLLISTIMFLTIMNNYPTIKFDDNYLYIWNFFSYKKVSWCDVKLIKKAPVSYDIEKVLIIELSRFSVFNRVFGLIYNELQLEPVVLVSSYTNNLDKLIEQFKARGKSLI